MCAPPRATLPVHRADAAPAPQAQGQLKLSSNGFYWRNTAGGKEVNVNAAGAPPGQTTLPPGTPNPRCGAAICFHIASPAITG